MKQLEDEIDLAYKHKGVHYELYSKSTQLVKNSRQDLENALEKMDAQIVSRIKCNEIEYRKIVQKYLKDKEQALKRVLGKLAQSNDVPDGKDKLISKLNQLVNKLESDGQVVLKKASEAQEERNAAME